MKTQAIGIIATAIYIPLLSILLCSCTGETIEDNMNASNTTDVGNATNMETYENVDADDRESELPSISKEAKSSSTDKDELTAVTVGSTIESESVDFEIISAEFTDYVQSPSYSSGAYQYLTPNDGNIYMDVVASITNKTSHSLKNPATVKCLYNSTYYYDATLMYENQSGGFNFPTLTSLEPLIPITGHFMISIPLEAQSSSLPLQIQISLKGSGEQYLLTIR
ncbi:hypothetical protein [uncultured Senegalimassilia sp.]|uniref:hypothetical protein n=1 Tax=uncultured Senegalimassilia sp. TaxID=1714350 RepID=UPI0025E9A1D1|nr:hypothetical protein [uncultured Senegalimassilia sp.]